MTRLGELLYPLFRRISVALSIILLHLICVLKEKGQTGTQGTRSRQVGGHQEARGLSREVIMKRQENSDAY